MISSTCILDIIAYINNSHVCLIGHNEVYKSHFQSSFIFKLLTTSPFSSIVHVVICVGLVSAFKIEMVAFLLTRDL